MKKKMYINVIRNSVIMSIIIALIVTSLSTMAFAKEDISRHQSTEIPKFMPGTVSIKFIDVDEYVIIDGEQYSDDKILSCQKEVKVEKAILPHEEYPEPEKNMIVHYGYDGQVNHIEFATLAAEKAFCTMSPKEEAIYKKYIADENVSDQLLSVANIVEPRATPYATWGSYPNKMYLVDSNRTRQGTGRATVFGDTTGQGNHTLQKGDIATKLQYDNCKLGLTVYVKMPQSGSSTKLTKQMKKWDAGSMPNAIVDIWKTGINYWGYTYTSSSLSNWASGNVTIEHANDMI